MVYVKKRCLKCDQVTTRNHNAYKCPCGGKLVNEQGDDAGCCPTCGKPINPRPRICGRCGKQIRNDHKWYVSGSTIYHKVCDDPQSYKPKKAGQT